MERYKDQETKLEDFDFSIMRENFYSINRESLLARKQLKERLSSRYIKYDLITSEHDFLEKGIRFLTRTMFGIYETISREKNPNIVFKFNSVDSYCGLTNNIIQIGVELLTNDSIKRQTKIDILTAIGIHEQYHKRFTVYDLKKELGFNKNVSNEDFYNSKKITKYISDNFPTRLYLIINNILEDKRIEKLGAEEFPGYVFFFEELRKYALFFHAEKKYNPEGMNGAIVDFLMVKILLPELEDCFFEQLSLYEKALVEEIKPKINNPIYDVFKVEWEEIKEIIQNIKKYIESNENDVFSDYWADIVIQTKKIHDLIPIKNEKRISENAINYIDITCELGGENRNKGKSTKLTEKEIQELQKIICDELKVMESEENKNADKNEQNKQIIEEHKIISADENDVYKTIQIIKEPYAPFDNILYNQAKKDSKQIFNQLGFLDSKYNRFIENYELTEGDLDETELFSISMGNKYLFEEIENIPGYFLDFGILLDESGSMHWKMQEAKLAVLSLLLALKDNSHTNIFCYGHTANHDDFYKIQMYKYYNSLQRFFDWKRIFSAKARSNNADGYAIEKMGEIMMESKSKDKILCVVSDGQPNANKYGGKSAQMHVKSVVQNLERKGINVIQICMDNIEDSPLMFNNFIPYEGEGKFFYHLKKILLTKLQQFSNQI